jgi:hypothetical protein
LYPTPRNFRPIDSPRDWHEFCKFLGRADLVNFLSAFGTVRLSQPSGTLAMIQFKRQQYTELTTATIVECLRMLAFLVALAFALTHVLSLTP